MIAHPNAELVLDPQHVVAVRVLRELRQQYELEVPASLVVRQGQIAALRWRHHCWLVELTWVAEVDTEQHVGIRRISDLAEAPSSRRRLSLDLVVWPVRRRPQFALTRTHA